MPSASSPAPASASSSPPHHWTLLDRLLFASLAVLCTICLVFSYYRVLKRLCCSFHAAIFSRNQVQAQLLLHDRSFDNPSPQNQSNALESTVIRSLPISQFKKENKEEPPDNNNNNNNTDCAVCLGEFEEGEWLKHLPNCTHAFHISCIDTWFQTHSSCPLCRSSVCYVTTEPECVVSVSVFTIMETLRREDFLQDRAGHYQMLRSEVLRSPELRYELTGGL
ncbi:hypothetical protein PTKIN_Ptkin03bG0029200 [Pterospermum kingtungense]